MCNMSVNSYTSNNPVYRVDLLCKQYIHSKSPYVLTNFIQSYHKVFLSFQERAISHWSIFSVKGLSVIGYLVFHAIDPLHFCNSRSSWYLFYGHSCNFFCLNCLLVSPRSLNVYPYLLIPFLFFSSIHNSFFGLSNIVKG